MNGESELEQALRISVVDPLSKAIDWTFSVLFRPFQIEKWFVLGFCAWLARLGEGGGGGGSSSWSGGDGDFDDFERGAHEAGEWLLQDLIPILIILSFIIVLILVIWLVVLWLSSRGKFMFLDGVVHNRGAVVDPWQRFRKNANSLFGFRVLLGIVGTCVILVILAITGLLVWAGVESNDDGDPLLILAVFFAILSVLSVAIAFALVGLAIKDFVVPIMYLRNCGVLPAWRELLGLFGVRPGAFVLYLIVRFAISVIVATVGIMVCCMTCCLVLIPYIGTVILLPLWVFLRSYPLYFLGQFGPDYARFATLGPADPASPIR